MSPIRTEQQPQMVLVKLLLSLYLPVFTAANEKAAAQMRAASSAVDLCACCHRRVQSEQAGAFAAQRLAADDVVVFGETAFSPST